MDDVAIAGAGPAGAFAALMLARAGLRVRVFDRATFPRPKLCGDTLNPGAVAVLARHLDLDGLLAKSDPIHGMLLTGPSGARVRGEYGHGLCGRAVTRQVLDQWLVEQAASAGASIETGVTVRGASCANGRIGGLVVQARGGAVTHPARVVIAADGRRSAIAVSRGLSAHATRPRRWAIGAYFSDVEGLSTVGEMHVRRGHYIGVAPVPGGLANACLVVPHASGDAPLARPDAILRERIDADPELAPRFARARAVTRAMVLGPMAVDASTAGEPGLLMAGDAAGFIDPMTGDGLRLAFAGAELAATVVQEVLAGRTPIDQAHVMLAERRLDAFRYKWRFNRSLRALVASPSSVTGAAFAARLWPSAFAHMIRYAGDAA